MKVEKARKIAKEKIEELAQELERGHSETLQPPGYEPDRLDSSQSFEFA